MAFGTGHHGTTLGCLRALDRLVDRRLTWRGMWPISAAARRCSRWRRRGCFPTPVIASDIDEVAVDVARANAEVNGLARPGGLPGGGRASITAVLQAAAPFDLVFANILKGPLIELAPTWPPMWRPEALAILSGLLVVQAEAILAAYVAAAFRNWQREDIGEWSTLVLRRA